MTTTHDLSSWVSIITTRKKEERHTVERNTHTKHDFLWPYINLLFKPTISPTMQALLACNQWQHVGYFNAAVPQVNIYKRMLGRLYNCSNNPVCENSSMLSRFKSDTSTQERCEC